MKDYIHITLKYAPLFIGIVFAVFGLVAANYSYLMVAVGMFIGVPLVVAILQFLLAGIGKITGKELSLYIEQVALKDYGFLKENP